MSIHHWDMFIVSCILYYLFFIVLKDPAWSCPMLFNLTQPHVTMNHRLWIFDLSIGVGCLLGGAQNWVSNI